jgi:ATP/maltotriose-dependent transcriptional regulator MalT
LDPASELAALNLLGTYFQTGNLLPASDLATELAVSAKSATLRQIGAATKLILDVTLEGDLDQAIASIGRLAEQSRLNGHTHFEGVSLLNTSLIRKAQGDAIGGLRDAGDAYFALSQGSTGWERQSARMAQAWALAHVGSLEEARSIISAAEQGTGGGGQFHRGRRGPRWRAAQPTRIRANTTHSSTPSSASSAPGPWKSRFRR